MPSIRAQVREASLVSVTGSNGVTATLTKAEVQAFFQTTSGSAAVRRQLTITWALQEISNRVGDGLLPPSKITLDINAATLDFEALETSD